MENEEVIKEVTAELEKYHLQITGFSYHELLYNLAAKINYLITNDFSFLISVLYRLDISEKKLKTLLNNQHNQTAGDIIAKMIIERQFQKIESRKKYKKSDEISEEDRW
jgi:hypothetical protein